jgi:phosphoribosyl 1,2-cyclic phosphodiesterase
MDGPTHEAMRKASIHSSRISPEHYKQFEIEPFDFIHKNGLGFAEGNVIKYVCRWREKDGIEDLKKAIRYIELLIEGEGGI